MSSDSEAPEEVSLTEGKVNYRVAKKKESDQAELNASLRKKKRKDKVEATAENPGQQPKKSKSSPKESAGNLDLLPDEVLEAVLGRVGQQEVQDKVVELEHGHTTRIGKTKKQNIEIKKGPVSVKVLQQDNPCVVSVDAVSFSSRMLGRHHRTTSMLKK